jgi:hypothetical protein
MRLNNNIKIIIINSISNSKLIIIPHNRLLLHLSSKLGSLMVSEGGIYRIARVLVVKVPTMKTHMRRGTSRGDPHAARTQMTGDLITEIHSVEVDPVAMAAAGMLDPGRRAVNIMIL